MPASNPSVLAREYLQELGELHARLVQSPAGAASTQSQKEGRLAALQV